MKKYEYFQGKAKIHLIGHLQRNKVKYVVGKTPLIHSVDSKELLDDSEAVGNEQCCCKCTDTG